MLGFYDFYTMGQFNGKGPTLICFRIYRNDRSFGSCHVVEEKDAAKNRNALIKLGYRSLNA